jgi:hypothetical protein
MRAGARGTGIALFCVGVVQCSNGGGGGNYTPPPQGIDCSVSSDGCSCSYDESPNTFSCSEASFPGHTCCAEVGWPGEFASCTCTPSPVQEVGICGMGSDGRCYCQQEAGDLSGTGWTFTPDASRTSCSGYAYCSIGVACVGLLSTDTSCSAANSTWTSQSSPCTAASVFPTVEACSSGTEVSSCSTGSSAPTEDAGTCSPGPGTCASGCRCDTSCQSTCDTCNRYCLRNCANDSDCAGLLDTSGNTLTCSHCDNANVCGPC